MAYRRSLEHRLQQAEILRRVWADGKRTNAPCSLDCTCARHARLTRVDALRAADDGSVYYVYYLLDPNTSERRWVGSTCSRAVRLRRHCYPSVHDEKANSPMCAWIVGLRPLRPLLQELCVVRTKTEAEVIEQELTLRLRAKGVSLLNIMAGRAW